MKASNRSIFKTLAIVIVVIFGLITIIGSGGSSGGGDEGNNETPNEIPVVVDPIEDNFKIDSHEFVAIPMDCANNSSINQEQFETMIEKCGYTVVDSSIAMDYDHVYAIKYQISNGQLNVSMINIEMVDSDGWVLDSNEFTIYDQEENMEIFNDYLIWLIDPMPGTITIDAWLENIDDIESDVYSFDIG